jgi:dihydrofolate reductase
VSIAFHTATTINGFLADQTDSLDWLFAIPGEQPDEAAFMEGVTVLVMGSTTYEWILRAENLLAEPAKWQGYFGARPTFVFTTRTHPIPAGADVRFVSGPVPGHLRTILDAAGTGTVWVQGGGDLVGQFLDADALDEIVLSIAPVFLAQGRPLLPRGVYWDRLRLRDARQVGEFAVLTYAVSRRRPSQP